MDINCSQFEGLLSFYLNDDLNDNLKCAFEDHMKNCSTCNMRYSVIKSLIEDIKAAYNDIIENKSMPKEIEESTELNYNISLDNMLNTELSAYIDNELDEDRSVKIRRDIITKPALRKKIEKLYNLRKVITNSMNEQKNKIKTDYSKEVIKYIYNKTTDRQVYFHCSAFIFFVILAVVISAIVIIKII